MKSEARIREKAENDYGGDFSKVVDVWAGSLIFKSEDEILNALEKLKDRADVVRIKDRWSNPDDSGYRDININIRLSNGVIVELQLHYQGIMDGKNGVGHLLYEFIRKNTKNADEVMGQNIKKVREISRALYEAGINGQYQTIPANLKASLRDMALALSNQTSAREAETLVNDLSELIRKTFVPSSSLRPSAAQRSPASGSSSRNSTANATSSPFSKYLSNLTASSLLGDDNNIIILYQKAAGFALRGRLLHMNGLERGRQGVSA